MPPRLKMGLICVSLLAGGFTLGTVADPDGPPTAPPDVANVRGHLGTKGSPKELRPLTVRVGDDLQQLGNSTADAPTLCTVYLDISGVPSVLSFEVPE